jgi:hypothetical protein
MGSRWERGDLSAWMRSWGAPAAGDIDRSVVGPTRATRQSVRIIHLAPLPGQDGGRDCHDVVATDPGRLAVPGPSADHAIIPEVVRDLMEVEVRPRERERHDERVDVLLGPVVVVSEGEGRVRGGPWNERETMRPTPAARVASAWNRYRSPGRADYGMIEAARIPAKAVARLAGSVSSPTATSAPASFGALGSHAPGAASSRPVRRGVERLGPPALVAPATRILGSCLPSFPGLPVEQPRPSSAPSVTGTRWR